MHYPQLLTTLLHLPSQSTALESSNLTSGLEHYKHTVVEVW